MSDKQINFNVDYKKLEICREYGFGDVRYPLVLASPHSGQVFPEEFLAAVGKGLDELRGNEDSFVDELIMPVCAKGIPLLSMNISRAFIDVNRD